MLNLVANLRDKAGYSLIRDRSGEIASVKTTPILSSQSEGVITDMNGDGIPDAVLPVYSTPGDGPSEIQVRAGTTNGTFDRVLGSFTTGFNPTSPVVADYDGDGIPDVAVATDNSPSAVYAGLQQTGGTYSVVPTPLPWPANILWTGDLNGDRIPDLIVAQLSTNNSDPIALWVMLGRGTGAFSAPAAITALLPYAAVFGDFNNDGRTDIVLTTGSSLYFLPGQGNGTFGTAQNISTLTNVELLTAGDFNGDGNLDIAAAVNPNSLYVFEGKGDGSFKEELADSSFPLPTGLVTADLNNDGKLDLLSWGFSGNDLTVYLGLGNGTFVPPTGSYYCVSGSGCFPTVVDMNGDGRPDIVSDDHYGILSTLFGR